MSGAARFYGGFFAACVVAGAAPAAAQTVAADVPFQLIDNRVFVPAELNGKGPFQMLLDTGAGSSGISLQTMRQIGAKAEGRESAHGAGEKTDPVVQTHISSLRIGKVEFRNLSAIAADYGALNDVIGFQSFDGIAGQDIFRRYVVDIDFATSRLRLIAPKTFRAPPGAIVIPFTFYEGFMPLVDGRIAGVRGKFIVDLGDRSSLTVFGPFWRRHRLDSALSATVDALTGYGVGGPIRGLVVRVPRFDFGKAEARGIVARLSLQRSGGFADRKIAGSIGTGVLRQFHTIIDYPRYRLLLLPRTQRPDRFDRAGWWIGRHGAQFEIFDIIADGPAAAAGLRVGDIITAIDRRAVESLDLFAMREKLRDPSFDDPLLVDFVRAGRPGQATLRPRDLLPGG